MLASPQSFGYAVRSPRGWPITDGSVKAEVRTAAANRTDGEVPEAFRQKQARNHNGSLPRPETLNPKA